VRILDLRNQGFRNHAAFVIGKGRKDENQFLANHICNKFFQYALSTWMLDLQLEWLDEEFSR
jgi:hypothetical protein